MSLIESINVSNIANEAIELGENVFYCYTPDGIV